MKYCKQCGKEMGDTLRKLCSKKCIGEWQKKHGLNKKQRERIIENNLMGLQGSTDYKGNAQ